MKENKEYYNSNGVVTTIAYPYYGKERYIFCDGVTEEGKKLLEKRRSRKVEEKKFYAHKSLAKVNEILNKEWVSIMLCSEDWSYTERYRKFLKIREKIKNNFN